MAARVWHQVGVLQGQPRLHQQRDGCSKSPLGVRWLQESNPVPGSGTLVLLPPTVYTCHNTAPHPIPHHWLQHLQDAVGGQRMCASTEDSVTGPLCACTTYAMGCMYTVTYVCMYVCMHVCMCVCVYVCVYVCMCVCVCMYVCMCMYVGFQPPCWTGNH